MDASKLNYIQTLRNDSVMSSDHLQKKNTSLSINHYQEVPEQNGWYTGLVIWTIQYWHFRIGIKVFDLMTTSPKQMDFYFCAKQYILWALPSVTK